MNAKLVKLVEFLKSIKAKNLSTFDLSEGEEEKYFIVVSGLGNTETKKIADATMAFLKNDASLDGYYKGEWIVIEQSPIVIHIFTSNERAKYNLDRLYKSKEIDVLKNIKKKKSK